MANAFHLCIALAGLLVGPAAAQQPEALDPLIAAIGGTPEQWGAAVQGAVEALEPLADDDWRALAALFSIADAEKVYAASAASGPEGTGAAERDTKLRELLNKARAALQADRSGPAPAPRPPPQPRAPGAPPPPAPPTPEAVKALIRVAIASARGNSTHAVAIELRFAPYPEVADLFEHVLSTHRGGDTEAVMVDGLGAGLAQYPDAEAAGLLYLLREDNSWNVQESLLRSWRRWSGPRVTRLLPVLIVYGSDAVSLRAASIAAEPGGLAPPEAAAWSLAERARWYRVAQDAVAAAGQTIPPLVDPAWDAARPIVAALVEAAAVLSPERQEQVVLDATASAPARKTAMRLLAFAGADGAWELFAALAPDLDGWETSGYALVLAQALSPERVPAIAGRLLRPAGAAPGDEATRLADGIARAETREVVLALASLAGEVGPEAARTALEDALAQQRDQLFVYGPRFAAMRNLVSAYGAVDAAAATGFFRSLLARPDLAVRGCAVYGLGELRVRDAVADLVAAFPVSEDQGSAGSVIAALGKIGTPEACDALAALALKPGLDRGAGGALIATMSRVCGAWQSGTWATGDWVTLADDPQAAGQSFVAALERLAAQTDDARLATWARDYRARLKRDLGAR